MQLRFWKSSEDDVKRGEQKHRDRHDVSPLSPSDSEFTVRDEELTDISQYQLAKWLNPERRTIRDQVKDNLSILTIIGFIGLLGAGLVTAWVAPFISLGSLYTWAPFGVLAVAVAIFYAGAKHMRGVIAGYTFVVAHLEDSAKLFIAEELDYTSHRYQVYKSWVLPGFHGETLKIQDLSAKLARKADTQYEEDDPVILRIKPSYTSSIDGTIIGDVVVTRGRQVQVDKYSDDSQLTITHPSTADESELEALQEQLNEEKKEVRGLRKELKQTELQNEKLRYKLRRTGEEHVDKFLEQKNKAEKYERRTVVRDSASDEYGSLDENEGDSR